MIISKIRGGLGNQLFCYAAGRVASIVNDDELLLDVSLYERGRRKRQSLLQHFCIRANLTTADLSDAPDRFGYNQRQFSFYPEFTDLNERRFMSGYWQSEKFFLDYHEIIRAELQPRDSALAESCRDALSELMSGHRGPTVSVHFRRGDYYTAKAMRPLRKSYYLKAMDLCPADSIFVLFSDDIEWCRKYIRGDKIVLCHVTDAIRSFLMMQYCDHHIIANSSFSWWAAWLAERNGCTIVAPDPDRWFRPERTDVDATDIIPDRWTILAGYG